jgi:hypothetical protein
MRVIEASTCVNVSKILVSIAGAMPMPLSAISIATRSGLVARRHADLAALGRELGGVLEDVPTTCFSLVTSPIAMHSAYDAHDRNPGTKDASNHRRTASRSARFATCCLARHCQLKRAGYVCRG